MTTIQIGNAPRSHRTGMAPSAIARPTRAYTRTGLRCHRSITITTDRQDGMWWLTIRDDGRGRHVREPGRSRRRLNVVT